MDLIIDRMIAGGKASVDYEMLKLSLQFDTYYSPVPAAVAPWDGPPKRPRIPSAAPLFEKNGSILMECLPYLMPTERLELRKVSKQFEASIMRVPFGRMAVVRDANDVKICLPALRVELLRFDFRAFKSMTTVQLQALIAWLNSDLCNHKLEIVVPFSGAHRRLDEQQLRTAVWDEAMLVLVWCSEYLIQLAAEDLPNWCFKLESLQYDNAAISEFRDGLLKNTPDDGIQLQDVLYNNLRVDDLWTGEGSPMDEHRDMDWAAKLLVTDKVPSTSTLPRLERLSLRTEPDSIRTNFVVRSLACADFEEVYCWLFELDAPLLKTVWLGRTTNAEYASDHRVPTAGIKAEAPFLAGGSVLLNRPFTPVYLNTSSDLMVAFDAKSAPRVTSVLSIPAFSSSTPVMTTVRVGNGMFDMSEEQLRLMPANLLPEAVFDVVGALTTGKTASLELGVANGTHLRKAKFCGVKSWSKLSKEAIALLRDVREVSISNCSSAFVHHLVVELLALVPFRRFECDTLLPLVMKEQQASRWCMHPLIRLSALKHLAIRGENSGVLMDFTKTTGADGLELVEMFWPCPSYFELRHFQNQMKFQFPEFEVAGKHIAKKYGCVRLALLPPEKRRSQLINFGTLTIEGLHLPVHSERRLNYARLKQNLLTLTKHYLMAKEKQQADDGEDEADGSQ